MSILNPNYLQQSLLLAGTLSLSSGMASAQPMPFAPGSSAPAPSASVPSPVIDKQEGRAGIATLCIEKRSRIDVNDKKIITPTIYIDAMPPEGIDTGYVPGNAVAKQWEDFLNPKDEEKKKWLEDTDIPDQANEAIALVKRLDKDKNGIISPKEFEDGEQGKSAEDKRIDLAFLTSLRCDNLYFTEGALDKIDLDAFPEVKSLKQDLGSTKTSLANLERAHTATLADLDETRKKAKNYMMATIGLGGLSLLLGVGLVIALVRKRPGTPPQTPKPQTPSPAGPSEGGKTEGAKTLSSDKAEDAKGEASHVGTGPRVVKDTTGAAPAAASKPAVGTKTVAVPDDIASALSEIGENASPAGGTRPSGAPSIDGVTPENVIINGTSAEAVAGITPTVVRAQIVLHYRHFLSQAAREALAAGRTLPADGEVVNSAFAREVQELTDRVIAEYHRMATTEPEALREMWTTQRDDGRPIVRRGAPQRLIMSVVGDYISAEASRAGSPFEGGVGTEVRREAERRAGETDFFEKGMREVLRDPALLGR